MDHLWVAASNTSDVVVTAFRHAMQNLRETRVLLGLPDRPVSPSGFVPALDRDYENMDRARATAAHFDASPTESSVLPSPVSEEPKKGLKAYEK
jgi:hypothetical protein